MNGALVPVAIAKDVFTLGGTVLGNEPQCETLDALQRIKDEAEEKP